jgi:protein involved in polysaccharide export with SLBB domain
VVKGRELLWERRHIRLARPGAPHAAVGCNWASRNTLHIGTRMGIASTTAAWTAAVTMSDIRRSPALHRIRIARALVVAGLLLLPGAASAQSAALKRATATRAELETLAASATGDEAAAIRTRLTEGDFRIGDRVVLTMTRVDTTRTDTLTVREGQSVEVPGLFVASLRGVLRSELEALLAREAERVVREPKVKARTLVRLSVLGEVGQPGFYWMTTDALMSDVIMNAGGPTPAADPSRTVIKRGTEELWDRKDVAEALRAGLTLDHLRLSAGDEVVVGKKRQGSGENTMRYVSTVSGVIVSIAGLIVLLSR